MSAAVSCGRQARLVFDIAPARLVLSLPAPPVPQAAAAARAALAAARRDRLPAAVAIDALFGRRAAGAAAAALDAVAAGLGPDAVRLRDDPAALTRAVAGRVWHRLHPAGVAHLRDLCVFSLGLHCAMDRAEMLGAETGALLLARRGLALRLPAGTAYARRADDPVLCAVRHTIRWIRAAGRDCFVLPLLRPVDPVTGAPLPVALTGEQLDAIFERAGKAAGLDAFSTQSLRLGYLAIGDRQGANVPALAAGARLADAKSTHKKIALLRNRTVA